MKLPPALEQSTAKFNAMSLRERVLVAAAVAAAIVMIWMIAIQDRIESRSRAMTAEISGIQEAMLMAAQSSENASSTDPLALARTREKELTAQLEGINAELGSHSAGLIPPERMVEVIHDVLSRQKGVKLISLHNKRVTGLAQRDQKTTSTQGSEIGTRDIHEETTGPYMHPVEIVIEGSYLDILAYLRALEGLSWQFYWKRLELLSVDYPLNRVRIELSTLSMEKEWIGV